MADEQAAGQAAAQGNQGRRNDWMRALALMNQPFYRMWETSPLNGDLNQDVSKWFVNFEYHAQLVPEITDATRLTELRKCLRDRALQVYQNAEEDEKNTYALSKVLLSTRLVYPHQVAIWRQEFHNRKKKETETVADYLRDLRDLVKLAYSGENENARNLVLKERFVSGLLVTEKSHTNYKLWKAAYLNLSKTLEEVVAAVNAAELNQKMFSLSSAVIRNEIPFEAISSLQASLQDKPPSQVCPCDKNRSAQRNRTRRETCEIGRAHV